jgi:hypothetical protein
MYIDDAGAYTYLLLTERSLQLGHIGVGEYLHRIACLRELLHSSNPLAEFLTSPSSSESEILAGWPEGEVTSPRAESGDGQLSSGEEQSAPSQPPWLFFISTAGCLRDVWTFKAGDPDFFPSVPHGHLRSKYHVKLDSYRGFTWDTKTGTNPCRESKAFIASLWNDPKFRLLAVSGMQHFCSMNPAFNWFSQRGILNPMRFPR